jgi:hypothetical protein
MQSELSGHEVVPPSGKSHSATHCAEPMPKRSKQISPVTQLP